MSRTLTLTIEPGHGRELTEDEYADLAHAIWSNAHVALGSRHVFRLQHDADDAKAEALNDQLNKRWKQLGEQRPWT